jgi:hypothetical protein
MEGLARENRIAEEMQKQKASELRGLSTID